VRITNKYNLPETIVNALNKPTYTKGGAHVSATELLSPPRMVQLRIANADAIEMDASDMVWSLFGTAIHGVLEHGQGDDHIVEQRLHTELDGWTISGAIDLQTVKENAIAISDYKTCGVYAVMNEKKEWEQQLNIYAWLVERVKKSPVDSIEIVAIIRDWKRRDAETKRDYPDAPIKIIPIELWPYAEREAFVKERIHLHAEAMFAAQTGGDLPLCSAYDTWEKPTTYAVKKIGNVRANKVCYKLADAEAVLQELGDKYEIEVRDGERTRCANYCNVRDFCSQWADYNQGK
jgi:PD-(D/E)XK nuclease superfamily